MTVDHAPIHVPMLGFVPGTGKVIADLDAIMEFGMFVQGTSRSGKTNLVRVLLEQTYGLVQHFVLDPEGEYVTLRSADRPYLVAGRGRDIEIVPDFSAVQRLVRLLVEKSVSVIFDLSEFDTESDDGSMAEQHVIVAAVCAELLNLSPDHPRNIGVIIEEMQDFAGQGAGRLTAHPYIRRLSKRGLKRGVFIVGASQRTSDVSKGVVTQLKSKAIGGTDHDDAPRALQALGMPKRDASKLAELGQGEFYVKGPAFERHAQVVKPPRSLSAPPKRRRGEAPTPAPEASDQIKELALALAAAAIAEPDPATGLIDSTTGAIDTAAVEIEIAERTASIRDEFLKREQRRFRRLESALDQVDSGLSEFRHLMKLYSGKEAVA